MGGIKCFTRIKVHKNFCDHLLFYEAVPVHGVAELEDSDIYGVSK